MTFLIGILARWGVPEPLRRAVAIGAAIIAALALLAILKGCYDHGVVKRHQAKVEAQAAKARDQSANERATDAITNTASEKDLHNAIDTAPKGGQLSPAAHALACERLRKLGRVPAGCGPAGGN